MRAQSSHTDADRGIDAYFSPPEAIASLLHIEQAHLPRCIWEPAAGDGAMVRPLRGAGYTVIASDIADYGLEDCEAGLDYLKAKPPPDAQGIVTNPPYKPAERFARKALREVPYVALLLRTNFLESAKRLPFFREHEPARIWISARRLPMMHRFGWSGLRNNYSNTCHAWFIWDSRSTQRRIVDWFDWKELTVTPAKKSISASRQESLAL